MTGATIVAGNVRPEYAAAERYDGEWVVSTYMGRAHLTQDTEVWGGKTIVHTACGRRLTTWFSAEGRAWDGCVRCVAQASPKA